MNASRARRAPRGSGWITFAGTLFLVVGTFNIINGIAMLVDDNYFVADELLFGDLAMWGGLAIFMGVGQLLVAVGVLSGSTFGLIVGIMWAGLNACLHLLMIGAYPAWSIIIMVVDGFIIYALTVYGGEYAMPDPARPVRVSAVTGEYGTGVPSFLSEPTSPPEAEPDHYMGRVAWVTFAGCDARDRGVPEHRVRGGGDQRR